jgi:hypothetical protein
MTIYQLIWLDESGYAPKSMQVERATDREVIDFAEHQTGQWDVIEIWDGNRAVCRCYNPGKAPKI